MCELVDDGTGIVSVIKWLPTENRTANEGEDLKLGNIYLIRGHVAFYREEIQVNAEEIGTHFQF